MLKIRLKRTGRRNNPSFRIIVAESTQGPKSGKAVDIIGFYNPKEGEKKIDTEKASHWISKGAQPSGTVHNMLVDEGVIKADKINVLPQKSPVVKDSEGVDDPSNEKSASDGAGDEAKVEKPAEEVKEDAKVEAEGGDDASAGEAEGKESADGDSAEKQAEEKPEEKPAEEEKSEE